MAVFEGDRTDACRACTNAAIASGELETYDDDLGPTSCIEGECLADCASIHGENEPAVCRIDPNGGPGVCELLPPGRFACGDLGGSCEVGAEICVIGDGCPACVPTTCSAADGCACVEAIDTSTWETPCADAPQCTPTSGGFVVTCTADGWGCG